LELNGKKVGRFPHNYVVWHKYSMKSFPHTVDMLY